MTRITLLLACVATAALAGCNNKDSHTIVAGGPEDDAPNEANLANVQLPPSITTSKSYRCKDNSVLRIDWLSDGNARVHKTPDGVGEAVAVGADGPLKGSSDASTITYQGKSCKA